VAGWRQSYTPTNTDHHQPEQVPVHMSDIARPPTTTTGLDLVVHALSESGQSYKPTTDDSAWQHSVSANEGMHRSLT